MTIKWTKWTDKTIKKKHGNIKRYRQLYDGDHAPLFSRSKNLIEKGEITDQIIEGAVKARNVQTPYIVANMSKVIVDIPAMFVSRAMGQITTSTSLEDFESAVIETEDGEMVDALENQRKMITGIAKRSNLVLEHKTNITHHQMDGGLVGVPYDSENGIRIDFKSRDVYYPHDDGMGCDLVYELNIEDEETEEESKYLHIYRERVEDETLYTEHQLFEIDEQGKLNQIIEEDDIKDILGLDEIAREFPGRDKPFVMYWPNNKTFTNPLGRSALHGQEGKQDEINWRLTMNSIVYERNGKPRIAVSKELFNTLANKAFDRYGDESMIDHRDLDIVQFNDQGKAMEIIQIDVTKIGDVKWVKDVIKFMMAETQTSEKAMDIFQEGGASAQSGVAKFYDMLNSIIKAEQIADEYAHFLQSLFENCLWIARQDDPNILVEEPRIQMKNMMPIARKELIEQESTALKNGSQSLRTTIENQNPTASSEWVNDEMEQIEESQASASSGSIVQSRQTLSNLMDNRNPNGTPTGTAGGTLTAQGGEQ